MPEPNRAPSTRPLNDAALAWELAAAAHPHLSRYEADRIYIAIGIGEAFDAIDALITAITRDRIRLGDDRVAAVLTWLDRYVGQPFEPRLRRLISEMQTSSPAANKHPDPCSRHSNTGTVDRITSPVEITRIGRREIRDGKLASPSESLVARRSVRKELER